MRLLLLCALLVGAVLADASTDATSPETDATEATSPAGPVVTGAPVVTGGADTAATDNNTPPVPGSTSEPGTEEPKTPGPTQAPATLASGETAAPAASTTTTVKVPVTTTTRAPRPTFTYEPPDNASAFVTARNLGGNGLDPKSVQKEIDSLTKRVTEMKGKVDAIADSFDETGSPVYKQLTDLLTQVQQADALLAQQQTALLGITGDLNDNTYEKRFKYVEDNVACFARECSTGP
mgnify:CR=1 FL=1